MHGWCGQRLSCLDLPTSNKTLLAEECFCQKTGPSYQSLLSKYHLCSQILVSLRLTKKILLNFNSIFHKFLVLLALFKTKSNLTTLSKFDVMISSNTSNAVVIGDSWEMLLRFSRIFLPQETEEFISGTKECGHSLFFKSNFHQCSILKKCLSSRDIDTL